MTPVLLKTKNIKPMKKQNTIKTVVLLTGLQGNKKVWPTLTETHHLRTIPFNLSGKSNGFIDHKYQSGSAWTSTSAGLKEEGGFDNL